MSIYATLLRPLLFRLDPETAHHLAIASGASFGWAAGAMRAVTAADDVRLATTVAGLRFPTPIGLAAGFDKSGAAITALAGLGFGSIEIGSVSIDPSQGNPKPRLWRIPEDKGIVVHYGLPNDGATIIAGRLAQVRLPVPLGINLVVTNRGPGAPPLAADQIIGEYVAATKVLAPRADYLMLNLSCPNTADGRDFFADAAHLDACLAALSELQLSLPVFLKVSPLGGIAAIERVLAAADIRSFVSGFMFNLPPVKPEHMRTPGSVLRAMPGAVSGPAAAALADFCIREAFRRMDRKRHVLIGAGGIATAEDAYAKIRLGASLVQLLTALIYEGPGVVRTITTGLSALLARDGFGNVADAVGVDA
ncbi:quinone-dependent dihydroorotate dehydrogenase [Bradyrhizobium sp. NP1]|uniref:quinone-dependent dihydroorotate dehydrogenase n=1 Tax=Bradyrhizobium sp. NP1 TaxID=3049772 RepID=UPI0025A4DD91|nr:quinone-dependent dihydroorotate dehydrogenase [Bradyrhizobium sp. NP1]WJR80556.1 quinone-dependent dihydroorotate dehydrogenase [Bradyrhizobium sp. NP1]